MTTFITIIITALISSSICSLVTLCVICALMSNKITDDHLDCSECMYRNLSIQFMDTDVCISECTVFDSLH